MAGNSAAMEIMLRWEKIMLWWEENMLQLEETMLQWEESMLQHEKSVLQWEESMLQWEDTNAAMGWNYAVMRGYNAGPRDLARRTPSIFLQKDGSWNGRKSPPFLD